MSPNKDGRGGLGYDRGGHPIATGFLIRVFGPRSMPRSKNFVVSPAQTIRQIRLNLNESRYSARDGIFGILKELVQNAEDAKATKLHFAWTNGIPAARHVLLRGPALLAVNDGPFKQPGDGKAVRRFGLNSKAGDTTTIGKFGLGLKSIFHLGEVFFFIATDKVGGVIDSDILNPWSDEDGGLHPDWDEFGDADVAELRDHAAPILSELSCFCLWIPLRREEQLGGRAPIVPNWAGTKGVDSIIAEDLAERLGGLLSMLVGLHTVEFSTIASKASSTRLKVSVENGALRRIPFENLERNGARQFHGGVDLSSGHTVGKLIYSGSEERLDDPELNRLASHKNWPQDLTLDETTGREFQVPEKARPHAAVCFNALKLDRGGSELSIQWSSFLPLGEAEVLPVAEESWRVQICLHGYFFVDAGRNQVEGLDGHCPAVESDCQPEQIRRAWNHRIARYATLPLIPSELAQIARHVNWSDQFQTAITRTLQGSKLFGSFGNDVCRRNAWIRRLTASGSFCWQVVPAGEAIFELPDADDRATAFRIFPALRDVADRRIVVLRQDPRLASGPAEPWLAEDVDKLLRSVSPTSLFSEVDLLDYLVRFLDESVGLHGWRAHVKVLTELVRQGLATVSVPAPVTLVGSIRRLVARLPASHRVKLRIRAESADLLSWLAMPDVSVAWIPEQFEPADSPSSGNLSLAESISVIQHLVKREGQAAATDGSGILSEVCAQVFRVTADRPALNAQCGKLPLFRATDCRDRREGLLSWESLDLHHRRRMLFVQPPSSAYHLQQALADESVVLITKDLYVDLFGGPDAPSCRHQQLIAALDCDVKPHLTEPRSRQSMLRTLLEYRDGRAEPRFFRCVRYLLHGDPAQFDDSDRLLVPNSAVRGIWFELAKCAASNLGEQWRFLDASVAEILSDAHCREFNVVKVGPDEAIDLAQRVDADCFKTLRPSDAEYRELLLHIDDLDLCRRLPIHEDVTGCLGSIDDHSFWEHSDFSLPEGWASHVRILRRSGDDATWRRQKQLARPFDAEALIKLALERPEPGDCWKLILDCLAKLESMPIDLRSALRTIKWLPTNDGGFAKPDDILNLPALRDDVARLVAAFPGVYYDPDAFAPVVREHPGFAQVQSSLFPSHDDALTMLGILLAEDERHFVGAIPISLDDWVAAFHGASDELQPAYALLRRAASQFPGSAQRTFELLQRAIPDGRTNALLDFLRTAHQTTMSASLKGLLPRVFGMYLKSVISPDNYVARLRGLSLPAQDGTWQAADRLCCHNDGIAGSAVVSAEIESALGGLFPLGPTTSLSVVSGKTDKNVADRILETDWAHVGTEISATGPRLRQYFDPWRDIIPNEQIGGFLSLLGDDPDVRNLAAEFLGTNRTLEETREKFGLPEMRVGQKMEDGLTMIHLQRVVVETVDGPTVTVRNLLGEMIDLPRNVKPPTIFVGYGSGKHYFPHRSFDDFRVICFRLNQIDPRDFTAAELSRLLMDSAIRFIGEAYNSREQQTSFRRTWEKDLAESDQLDISITQSRIIEHGFLILDQYGLRSTPELAEVLKQWDAADRLKAEQNAQSDAPPRAPRRNPDVELEQARRTLRQLLEQNQEAQRNILAAVRQRIADYYQYETDSIPFELFQNADDAYVELERHFVSTSESHSHDRHCTFSVARGETSLGFVHLGRRINQYPIQVVQASQGFDSDLWKMSVLSLSNKGQVGDARELAVTGKFGLGFKSVFLACDRPRMLSGRLALEFVGGLYPRRLIGDERHSLEDLRARLAGADTQATVIELELAPHHSADEVLGRFEELAHILVVFARRIRQCAFTHRSAEVRWEPAEVLGIPGCFVGALRTLPGNSNAGELTRALLFESDHGSFLFAIGGREVTAFGPDVPTIWVTAPTREPLDVGFLVNGPFALDVGRAQLARDHDQNAEKARYLGRVFGEQLARLFQLSETANDWHRLRVELGLATDTTTYHFWNSLWERLLVQVAGRAHGDEPAQRLLRAILWDADDIGAAGFYARHAAVPSRLPESSPGLVSLRTVRYALTGILAADDDAFAIVRSWPGIMGRAPAGTVVSDAHVFRPLRELCPQLVSHVQSLDLNQVLAWELVHEMVSPEKAAVLGMLIDKSLLDNRLDIVELGRVREILEPLQFLARDGRYHSARELLIGHQTKGARDDRREDERFRARFAPAARILSEQYDAPGIAFFEACREKLDAGVRQLAEWVRQAADQITRKSALEYLAVGEQGRQVKDELLARGIRDTWLQNLAQEPVFRELDEGLQYHLAELLPRGYFQICSQPATAIHAPDPEKVLRQISAWWIEERTEWLPSYEKRTFPNGQLQLVTGDAQNGAEPQRKDWTILFLLGLMHTMGRTQSEAHRGFLRECDRAGWLDMFATSQRDPKRWLGFIDNYLQDKVDETRFLQWMKQFVGIYQVSRYLDDYIEAFRAADRFPEPFPLTDITEPRASKQFQGGGVAPPPLSSLLGIGACFVVRELVRRNVVTNPLIFPHCYVPVKRVRALLTLLRCPDLDAQSRRYELSPIIHHFLVEHLGGERAIFQRDFDIPLQIVAETPELQYRFLQQGIPAEDEDGDD